MREAVDVADDLFHRGLPLIKTVDRRLALDLELFSRGGHARARQDPCTGLRRVENPAGDFEMGTRGILLRCLPRLVTVASD